MWTETNVGVGVGLDLVGAEDLELQIVDLLLFIIDLGFIFLRSVCTHSPIFHRLLNL